MGLLHPSTACRTQGRQTQMPLHFVKTLRNYVERTSSHRMHVPALRLIFFFPIKLQFGDNLFNSDHIGTPF